jgi:simple sugar transport system substrate-binding protein
MKRLWAAAALVLAALAVPGAPRAAGKKFEIVTVVKITGIPWFNRLEEGVKQAATDLGVNAYQVGPADADPAQQVKLIEDLIAKGVDAIVVTPNDAKALEPVLAKARAKKIVVVTHESPDQKGKDYDLELIDNVKFGQHAWDVLAKYTGGEGEYAVFVGGLTVPLHNLWADEGIKYAKTRYPKLKLVTDRIPAGEDQALAKQKTLELLKAYPNLKGIVGFGSLGPPGAAQALIEKGLAGKVVVVGTILPTPAAAYLKNGSIQQGVLWDPKNAGFGLTWIAKQLLEGKKIAEGSEIPGVGKVHLEGDVIKVNAAIDITKENVDTFGF